jgi:16S rRNA (cytosine1402-N4)-methyltransferase
LFQHVTVLRDEAVEGLHIKEDGIYVDCTLGGAGHSQLIASRLQSNGMLIGIDQDDRALAAANERLKDSQAQIHLVKSNFRALKQVLEELNVFGADGILFDLGVSSPQLDEAERGFSYNQDAPLDMRMDQESEISAFTIVNEWDEEELASIIYRYGEEKFSRRIARSIRESRQEKPIETTLQLAEIVKYAIPAATRRTGPHPAKRTFQAIRIAVNEELDVFASALEDAIALLNPNGRVSVITFHSLEDRICKKTFQKYATGCTCPPDFPKCVCDKKSILHIVNKKPIVPSELELKHNPRARSAKLRIAEKNQV